MIHQRHLFTSLLVTFLLIIGGGYTTAQPEPRTHGLQVEAGGYHTCGIRANDTVACWGWNNYGQSTPPVDLGTVKLVSAGTVHSCAITTTDTVRCWGYDGDGAVSVPADLGTVKGLSAGGSHTCAVRTDGIVRCWGSDLYGQSTPPVDLGTAKAVSTGSIFSCAIKTDNTVRCWGDNENGEVDVPVDLGTVKAISSGRYFSCAITTLDTVRCWGKNEAGQITVPADLGTVKALDLAGASFACVITSTDTVRCWGMANAVPGDLGTVKTLSAGTAHTCAVTTADAVKCWGTNNDGQTNVPQPSVTLETAGMVLYEGDSTTVEVKLSDFPWSSVTVNLALTGTAALNTDYTAGNSVSMTISENKTDLVVTIIDDNDVEANETIILDVDSVIGGAVESVPQQTAFVVQDELSNINLISNNGFESALTPWIVKLGVGDKVKCNKDGKPPVARSGVCAFQFKSGAGEKTKLDQTVAASAQVWSVGDILNLSAYVKATNSATNGRIKVRVKYSDGTSPGKLDATITQNSDYAELVGSYTLLSASVSKIKLSVQNRGTAGKVLVDDVALLYTAVGEAGLVPLP